AWSVGRTVVLDGSSSNWALGKSSGCGGGVSASQRTAPPIAVTRMSSSVAGNKVDRRVEPRVSSLFTPLVALTPNPKSICASRSSVAYPHVVERDAADKGQRSLKLVIERLLLVRCGICRIRHCA